MIAKLSELDTSSYPITTGCVRYRDLAYLVIVDPELVKEKVAHSTILGIDRGQIGGVDLPWTVASVAVCHAPAERMIAVGRFGHVYTMGGGSVGEEPPIQDGALGPMSRGPLREVRGIAGGRAYAVGTCRQCYRREGPGIWICIDATAQSPDGSPLTNKSFESIDGFSDSEIYAVGWDGEIWSWDGAAWRQQHSPTDVALHKVICADDGNVYVCGKMGTIIRGRGALWEIVEQNETEDDFWGMAWFGGRLYLATTHFLYYLADGAISMFRPEEDQPSSCYHLSAADGVMWSIGFTEVYEMTAQGWSRLV